MRIWGICQMSHICIRVIVGLDNCPFSKFSSKEPLFNLLSNDYHIKFLISVYSQLFHPIALKNIYTSNYSVVELINALRPRQHGHHFADGTYKCSFLNGNVWILIQNFTEAFSESPTNYIPALVLIMAWGRTGEKPLSKPMMALFSDAYMLHSDSISLKIPFNLLSQDFHIKWFISAYSSQLLNPII